MPDIGSCSQWATPRGLPGGAEFEFRDISIVTEPTDPVARIGRIEEPNWGATDVGHDFDLGRPEIFPRGGRRGEPIVGEEILVPTFEVASNPTISLDDIRARRFDIIDRQEINARAAMQTEEDRNIFDSLIGAVRHPETTHAPGIRAYVPEPSFGDDSRWEEI